MFCYAVKRNFLLKLDHSLTQFSKLIAFSISHCMNLSMLTKILGLFFPFQFNKHFFRMIHKLTLPDRDQKWPDRDNFACKHKTSTDQVSVGRGRTGCYRSKYQEIKLWPEAGEALPRKYIYLIIRMQVFQNIAAPIDLSAHIWGLLTWLGLLDVYND